MTSFLPPVILNSREEPATPPRVLSDAQGLINHLLGLDTTQGTPLAPAPPYHEPFYIMSATRGLVLTAPFGNASLGHALPERDASDTSSASDSFEDSYGYGVELSVATSADMLALAAAAAPDVPVAADVENADTDVNEIAVGQADSTLLNLPPVILDRILGMDYTATDHLAISGVCQGLRKVYTKTVLAAVVSEHQLNHLTDQPSAVVLGSIATRYLDGTDVLANEVVPEPPRDIAQNPLLRLRYKTRAATQDDFRAQILSLPDLGQHSTLSKTAAKSAYKVTDKDIATIKPHRLQIMGGGHARHTYYSHPALRRLAFRVHGGPVGHKQHLDKAARTAAKANATRQQRAPKESIPSDAEVAQLAATLRSTRVRATLGRTVTRRT